MAQLGLEVSKEVEGFRRPKQAQIEAEYHVSDLDVVVGNTSSIYNKYTI